MKGPVVRMGVLEREMPYLGMIFRGRTGVPLGSASPPIDTREGHTGEYLDNIVIVGLYYCRSAMGDPVGGATQSGVLYGEAGGYGSI